MGWHKPTKENLVPGAEVSYRNVNQWQSRGLVIEMLEENWVLVLWRGATINSREYIQNLYVWNDDDTPDPDVAAYWAEVEARVAAQRAIVNPNTSKETT